jgi:hypothetical protein
MSLGMGGVAKVARSENPLSTLQIYSPKIHVQVNSKMWYDVSMDKDRSKTGSGGVRDNVRDELEQAVRSPSPKPTPEEESESGSGGVKDAVKDELSESQRR